MINSVRGFNTNKTYNSVVKIERVYTSTQRRKS